jgi:Predicted solute binding protein
MNFSLEELNTVVADLGGYVNAPYVLTACLNVCLGKEIDDISSDSGVHTILFTDESYATFTRTHAPSDEQSYYTVKYFDADDVVILAVTTLAKAFPTPTPTSTPTPTPTPSAAP